MATPLNGVPSLLSHPATALIDSDADRLVFGRPVQAHDNIDKQIPPRRLHSGSTTAHRPGKI